MNWQTSTKLVAIIGFMTVMSINAPTVVAQSKDLERSLAGVRLNASSRTVLTKFGNPNEIYIGDIGVRLPGSGAQGTGGQGMAGSEFGGGMPSGPSAGMGSGMAGMRGGSGASGGMMGGMGGMGGGGSGPGMGGGMPAGMRGSRGGGGGTAPGMMGGGGGKMGSMGGGAGRNADDGDGGTLGAPGGMMGGKGGGMMGGGMMGGMGGGMMGGGMMGGMGGGMMGGGDGGGAVGAFGRTQSTVARQQEVTWVYNRTTKDAKGQSTAVSYEFLINPSGAISQIRCLGYHSPTKSTANVPTIVTQKGVRLGSSYVEVLRAYGQPEEYEKAEGNILILSYPKKHVQFQLINQKEQADPTKAAYRVISLTIATIEG